LGGSDFSWFSNRDATLSSLAPAQMGKPELVPHK
jgi:hypothetical protein